VKRDVIFKGNSFADFNNWQSTDLKNYKKIAELIEDTRRNPFSGKGNPEPLKHKLKGCWSKRITKEHRLVYKVTNEAIKIISCKYHYK
jgi:toxin YoeB